MLKKFNRQLGSTQPDAPPLERLRSQERDPELV
jgi:hypothetical protein